jgi:type VI secretion system protein ImpK
MFLMEKLHEFFSEVLSVRRRMEMGELTARAAREQLQHTLGRQRTEAERNGGHYAVERYTRAKYAFVALADEMFLRGATREEWVRELLEAAEFRSQRAGEKIFTDIDALQSERGADTDELARVYLAVLGLGFEGQFRGQGREAADALREYREKLHRIIFGRDPEPLREEEKIVPAAYRELLDAGARAELPYLRPWILTIVAIFVVFFIASHLLWRNATKPLHEDIDEILHREAALISIARSRGGTSDTNLKPHAAATEPGEITPATATIEEVRP